MVTSRKKKTSKGKASPSSRAKATKKASRAPKKKTVKKRKSKMSMGETTQLTRAEAALMEKMATLDPEDPHYRILEAALAFKASWVILGEHLNEVYLSRSFKDWGYASFSNFCSEELRVSSSTARKLVKSYQWLGEEAPEFIPRVEQGRITPDRPVPDYNTIGVLADARKEYQAERVPEDAYLALKQAALEGDRTPAQLRKELKESIPESMREQNVDPVRTLRKALTSSVRTIDALREWDGSDELLVQAEQLRDAIAHHLPRKADGTDPEVSGTEEAAPAA